MKELLYIYGPAIPVVLVVLLLIAIKSMRNNKKKSKAEHASNETNYSQSYQAKYLLTKNEWYEYKKLKKHAEEMNLQVCPKVRLLDIVEPRRGTSNYMSLMGKVQSKHIDFLICDQNFRIKAIVELDDNSHNKPDRQERDLFVDEVLTSVGYKIIRTRSITENTLKPLANTVSQQQTKQATTEPDRAQACQETA